MTEADTRKPGFGCNGVSYQANFGNPICTGGVTSLPQRLGNDDSAVFLVLLGSTSRDTLGRTGGGPDLRAEVASFTFAR